MDVYGWEFSKPDRYISYYLKNGERIASVVNYLNNYSVGSIEFDTFAEAKVYVEAYFGPHSPTIDLDKRDELLDNTAKWFGKQAQSYIDKKAMERIMSNYKVGEFVWYKGERKVINNVSNGFLMISDHNWSNKGTIVKESEVSRNRFPDGEFVWYDGKIWKYGYPYLRGYAGETIEVFNENLLKPLPKTLFYMDKNIRYYEVDVNTQTIKTSVITDRNIHVSDLEYEGGRLSPYFIEKVEKFDRGETVWYDGQIWEVWDQHPKNEKIVLRDSAKGIDIPENWVYKLPYFLWCTGKQQIISSSVNDQTLTTMGHSLHQVSDFEYDGKSDSLTPKKSRTVEYIDVGVMPKLDESFFSTVNLINSEDFTKQKPTITLKPGAIYETTGETIFPNGVKIVAEKTESLSVYEQTYRTLKTCVELDDQHRRDAVGFSDWIKQYRTFSFNPGRQAGKTTAIVRYINENPDKKFLYVAHNKSQIENVRKKIGSNNVTFATYATVDPYNRGRSFDGVFFDDWTYRPLRYSESDIQDIVLREFRYYEDSLVDKEEFTNAVQWAEELRNSCILDTDLEIVETCLHTSKNPFIFKMG